MKIGNLMSKSVEQTVADATVAQAAGLMKSFDVGILPVFEGEDLVGVITDRDIVTRAVAEGVDPDTTRVREIMTPTVFFCHMDDDVEEAARIMEQQQVRRLVVLDEEGKVVGICSLGDMVLRARHRGLAADLLEEVVRATSSSHS